jgi:hypothetical protein
MNFFFNKVFMNTSSIGRRRKKQNKIPQLLFAKSADWAAIALAKRTLHPTELSALTRCCESNTPPQTSLVLA